MSVIIRQRDRYMCVYCWQHDHVITTADLEVHHIVPIDTDYDKRLDEENLITLCRYHHELAEQGSIDSSTLMSMVEVQMHLC